MLHVEQRPTVRDDPAFTLAPRPDGALKPHQEALNVVCIIIFILGALQGHCPEDGKESLALIPSPLPPALPLPPEKAGA